MHEEIVTLVLSEDDRCETGRTSQDDKTSRFLRRWKRSEQMGAREKRLTRRLSTIDPFQPTQSKETKQPR